MTNTSPGWPSGYTPSALEWSNAFLVKPDAANGILNTPSITGGTVANPTITNPTINNPLITGMQLLSLPTTAQPANYLWNNNGAVNIGAGRTPALLFQSTTSVGNGADTTQDVLKTFSVPANTLRNVGDRLRMRAGGTFAATTDAKTLAVRWGGGNLNSFGVSTVSQVTWRIELDIMKTGSNAQSWLQLTASNSQTVAGTTGATPRVDTAAILLEVTGQNTTAPTAGSIACSFFTVDFMPASA